MRLGEVLIEAGLLNQEQLDDALRAQVMWGGRLGTNLVELGILDLDELSKALGKLHGIPAALGTHFERADRELQHKLPAELAEKYECLPLVRAGKHIVIASTNPLDERAVALIAGQLDINRTLIVQSIAAEMRIRFQLERVYEIPRGQRFMRSRGTTMQSQLFSIPEVGGSSVAQTPKRRTRTPAKSIPATTIDSVVRDLPAAPRTLTAEYDPNVERRTYLRTLADMLSSHPDAESVVARMQRVKPHDPARPFALGSTPMPKINVAVIPDSLPEALSAIELAPDRDELSRRVIGTVARFVPECRSALLLVVRGVAAVSWTSFCRDGTDLPPLAVPLDHPGLCAAVMRRKIISRGASGDLTPIDYLLLASLGAQWGELIVAPFGIAGHVIGSIVVALDSRTSVGNLEAITSATGEAFARLMRGVGTPERHRMASTPLHAAPH